MENIVSMYEDCGEEGREYEYIKAKGYNLHSVNAKYNSENLCTL